MRILLLGKTGQVGWELQRTLLPFGNVTTVDYPDIDLAQPDGIRNLVREVKPQIIINASAFTDVEKAESELELAFAINGIAPGILAEEAKALGSTLIHYSTDYVFDGKKGSPYSENDQPNPINVYGKSKLAGEQAIQQVGCDYLILRTSWVYSLRRKSFVTNVLNWARQNHTLRIVTDQVSNPTWCRLLAEVTAQIVAIGRQSADWLKQRKGLYHLAGAGYASRFDFASAILSNLPAGVSNNVETILSASSQDFSTLASRPLFSALNIERFTQTFGFDLPDWKTSLQLALANSNFSTNCYE